MNALQRRDTDPDNIVLHILTHVDEKIQKHENAVHEQLQDIRLQIEEGQKSSEKRHNSLMQTITSWAEKSHETPCPALASSIPNGDWPGHHNWHIGEMDWQKEKAEAKRWVIKALITTGSVGFMAWVGTLMWFGFLHGPKT